MPDDGCGWVFALDCKPEVKCPYVCAALGTKRKLSKFDIEFFGKSVTLSRLLSAGEC